MRYYDTTTHTEVLSESTTTIPMTDERVRDFFRCLEEDEYITYIDDLPIIKKVELPENP